MPELIGVNSAASRLRFPLSSDTYFSRISAVPKH